MLRIALFCSALLVCIPAVAVAQGPPNARFAGGAVGPGQFAPGTSEVGAQVDAAGTQITLRGAAVIKCRRGTSEATFVGTLPIGGGGAFSGALARGRQMRSPGFTSSVSVQGTVNAQEAAGTLSVRTKQRGRAACTGDVPFRAIPGPSLAGAAPAPAPANATLLGMTSDSRGPFAFNLRVSANGKRVTQALFGVNRGCKTIKQPEETDYTKPITIRPDGTFRRVERFTVRYTDATERNRVVIAGRFVNGGAVGTIRWTAVARSPKTGRVNDRCDTGRLTWSAAP